MEFQLLIAKTISWRMIKYTIANHRKHYEDRVVQLRLWSLEERRNRTNMIEIFSHLVVTLLLQG